MEKTSMIKRKREILFFISVIFYVISVAIFIFFMKSYTKISHRHYRQQTFKYSKNNTLYSTRGLS